MKLLSRLKVPYLECLSYWLAQVLSLSILAIGFSNKLIHSLTYEILLFVIFVASCAPAIFKSVGSLIRDRIVSNETITIKRLMRSTLETTIDIYNCFVVLTVFMISLSAIFAVTLPNMPLSHLAIAPAMLIGIVAGYQVVTIQRAIGAKLFHMISKRTFRKK